MENKKDRIKHLFEDKQATEVKTYSKKYAATMISIISVVLCALSIAGFLFIKYNFSDVDLIKQWIDEHYFLGLIVMALICCVQVIIAFIPGELVEIAAGYAFGPYIGSLVCVVGIMCGSVIAILLARKFGRRLVESLYPRDKIDALPILNNPSKRNTLTFLLFLIPGTPKDLFTYVVGLTEMSIPLYIALTMFARFPSIIMSTFGGDALGDNKIIKAAIMFIITGIISGVGYLIYKAIQKKHNEKNKK